jgi:hypothetical protein
MSCLTPLATRLRTSDGIGISAWSLAKPGAGILSDWAKHFREHYCLDSLIDSYREGTSLSREEYLLQLVFPNRGTRLGPAVRSGDFSEILICDFLEFVQGFSVVRDRLHNKQVPDESPKGVDVIAYKMVRSGAMSANDVLLTFEVKAQCSAGAYSDRLQDAVKGSITDVMRLAFSLNAAKQRRITASNPKGAAQIERFQNLADRPYVRRFGAAAILDHACFDPSAISSQTDCSRHPDAQNLQLIVITGRDLMTLVHSLYEMAAREA